jgi:hypothetical protein
VKKGNGARTCKKRAGPCKLCGRTHKTRCWKRYKERKAARKKERESNHEQITPQTQGQEWWSVK